MKTFRRRPVEIEAIQFTGDTENVAEILADVGDKAALVNGSVPHLVISHPREGKMVADRGDWIVKNGRGEFYPVERHAFERMYEPV